MTNQQKSWRAIRGLPKSYSGIHNRLVLNHGNAPLCIWDESHDGRLEWANVTGEYTVNLEDYLPMCASCHRKFDYTEDMRGKISKRSKCNEYATKGTLYQSDVNDKIVGEYSNAYQAERMTGVLHTAIANNLAGRSTLAGGYRWTRKLS